MKVTPFNYLYQHLRKDDQKQYAALDKISNNLNTPVYRATLLIKDTTVGKVVGDVYIVHDVGVPYQLIGVLRKAITADLSIQFRLRQADTTKEVILIKGTIPKTHKLYDPIVFTSFEASVQSFNVNDTILPDILASDGSKDAGGVASFVLTWK